MRDVGCEGLEPPTRWLRVGHQILGFACESDHRTYNLLTQGWEGTFTTKGSFKANDAVLILRIQVTHLRRKKWFIKALPLFDLIPIYTNSERSNLSLGDLLEFLEYFYFFSHLFKFDICPISFKDIATSGATGNWIWSSTGSCSLNQSITWIIHLNFNQPN